MNKCDIDNDGYCATHKIQGEYTTICENGILERDTNAYKHNGITITIDTDDSPDSPRDWDNLGTMACKHGRYTLGDSKHDVDFNDSDSWLGIEQQLTNMHAVFLPVYMYDHSGLRFSVHDFNDRWDSGRVGYIYATAEQIRQEYGVKNITAKVRTNVLKVLTGEVETYDQWHAGDVYGFTITDVNGDTLDSCWGFYGYDYCKAEAEAQANYYAKQPRITHKPRNARELHA